MVKKISENEFNEVLGSKAALVDFSATWCGPCKMLAPVLEGISEAYGDKVAFYNIDVDDNPSRPLVSSRMAKKWTCPSASNRRKHSLPGSTPICNDESEGRSP